MNYDCSTQSLCIEIFISMCHCTTPSYGCLTGRGKKGQRNWVVAPLALTRHIVTETSRAQPPTIPSSSAS